MVTQELLNSLRYKSEGTDLDFKSEQYRFVNASDHEKAAMLKDILAMANAWRDGTGYILLGFKESRPALAEVVGITEQIDDAQIQQFVNSKVKPKLTFRYEEHQFEDRTVGVIAIPKQKRPFFISNQYGGLSRNVAYVRRGSSTEEAEPTEVAAMALADNGRGQVHLELSILTLDNESLPDKVELSYLSFPEELPDYDASSKTDGTRGVSVSVNWRIDNADFWREYAEYRRVHAALIEVKFVLHNASEVQLSNAKLEVSVEALDEQLLQLIAGTDLPEEPSQQLERTAPFSGLPDVFTSSKPSLMVDEDGDTPLCHVRFGTLLPGEKGRSSDTLAIVPSAPGKMLMRFRILGSELNVPQESTRVIDASGDVVVLDIHRLEELHFDDLVAQYSPGSDT